MGTTLSIFLQFRISALSCIFLITISTVYSCVINKTSPAVWKKEDYPNPHIDIDKCGRNCTESWICDPDRILSIDQADRLDRKIEEIAVSGNCGCSECEDRDGHNISIALLSQFSVPQGSDNNTEAKVFTEYLRKTWSFQKCGNNVVILVSRDNRQVYTSAGPSAYNILTLTCIEQVYTEVKPVLSRGDYGDALYSMLIKYQQIFAHSGCSSTPREDSSSLSGGEIAGIIFAVVALVAFSVPTCLFLCNSSACRSCADCCLDVLSCGCCSRKTISQRNEPPTGYCVTTSKGSHSYNSSGKKYTTTNSNKYRTGNNSGGHKGSSNSSYSDTGGSSYTSTLHTLNSTDFSTSNSGSTGIDSGFSGGCSSDGGGGGGGDF